MAQVPGNGWAQIVAFAGYYELFVYKYSGTPGPDRITVPDPAEDGRRPQTWSSDYSKWLLIHGHVVIIQSFAVDACAVYT